MTSENSRTIHRLRIRLHVEGRHPKTYRLIRESTSMRIAIAADTQSDDNSK
jgi:hypothetical protein